MPREYRHIKEYETEIVTLREQGKTYSEIGSTLGFTLKQIKRFFCRLHKNQRKLSCGIEIKPKGRPRKDGAEMPPSVQQMSKLYQLQYKLAKEERYIKHLEMENVLMRDFLSLTGRK